MKTAEINEEELRQLTAKVVAISTETGAWMRDQVIDESTAEIKSHNNLVTFVDHESERRFIELLTPLIPGAHFIAEETQQNNAPVGFNWVIDPLDGTTNFVHGVPIWCTSVALCIDSTPVSGVIFDPNSGECFHGYQGGGAFCGTERIHVSGLSSLSQALLATGFPYHDFGRQIEYLELFKQLMKDSRGMRRLGSAALDMAWVANGRFEGFYEYGLSPWDVAAGTLLVREAGGMVTAFHDNGDPVFGRDILATNGRTHGEMLNVIRRHFREQK